MTEKKSKPPEKSPSDLRKERLAQALRDNLRRRKGRGGGKAAQASGAKKSP
jgi:hypothetical protein